MKALRIFLAIFLFCGGLLAREDLPPVEVISETSPANARNQQIIEQTRELREKRDTVGLEALAAELRARREQLDGGSWMLTNFYKFAVNVPEDEAGARAAMDFYEQWARERPQSITARICLAKALVSHAWNARGSGWASTVTEDGWRLMAERLSAAWDVLEQARELEEKCPEWYCVAQSVALGQGWERSRYIEMVQEAIDREPTYGNYYTQACYWLFPRWHGEPGDFEAWIATQADARPESERDWQYARLVWMADRNGMKSEMVFAPGRLDWERAKRGFGAWLKAMPDNLAVHFELLRLALLADDRETARRQFDFLGGKFYPPMWKDEAQFEAARAFAYGDGANPYRAREKNSRPAREPRLEPHVLDAVKLGFRIFGGFVGGVLVGLCLLGLGWQRGEIVAGLIAAMVSVVLATAFGTIATLAPALALWLYFRRKNTEYPPPLGAAHGWSTLLWVIVIMAVVLGLQVGAVIFAAIPHFLEVGRKGSVAFLNDLASDGSILLYTFNSFWIGLLLLLLICRPQSRAGWEARLGLSWFPVVPGLLWAILLAAISFGVGLALEPFMDEKSRESLALMSRMSATPILYFLVVGVAAPVFEELLYRGYCYGAWIGRLGFWGTAAASSLIFSLSHVQYGWVGLCWVFLFGMLLAGLRWKSGSIYPCIATHMIYNFASCVLVMAFPP